MRTWMQTRYYQHYRTYHSLGRSDGPVEGSLERKYGGARMPQQLRHAQGSLDVAQDRIRGSDHCSFLAAKTSYFDAVQGFRADHRTCRRRCSSRSASRNRRATLWTSAISWKCAFRSSASAHLKTGRTRPQPAPSERLDGGRIYLRKYGSLRFTYRYWLG